MIWFYCFATSFYRKSTKKSLMEAEKIICWNCSAEIVQYYNEGYKGKRARCPICGVDFPLE